jgi:23S rRNA pseudouridine1911/1915/1917 synthase
MNHGWTYSDRINGAEAGLAALAFYARRYPHSTEAAWRERLERGEITRDGQTLAPATLLAPRDTLQWNRPPWEEPEVPTDITILYEDAELLAVDKPAGLPVLPDGGFLENTLLHLLGRRHPAGEPPAPVHRLGRGTSGILLFARTAQARRHLCAQFRDATRGSEGGLRKVYRALTGAGPDLPDALEITQPIGRVPHPRLAGGVYAATPDGLPACSRCRVLARNATRMLWEIDLITGRPHQIRIHLASIGAPLLGDPLYGPGGTPRTDGAALPGDIGYTLHACSIRFTHPRTERPMELSAPIPGALQAEGSGFGVRCGLCPG